MAAPAGVAFLRVAGADAPEVFCVVWKNVRHFEAPEFVHFGGDGGVGEVVGVLIVAGRGSRTRRVRIGE